MYKMIDFNKKLEEINKKQREGVDQTENYSLLFGGDPKLINMAKIDAVKEEVQNGAFYLSRLKSKTADDYLIVDMYKGHIYKINSQLYVVQVVDDNILVTNKETGDKTFLIDNKKLAFGNIRHLGEKNYTFMSSNGGFKGVPALRIDNDYTESIRVHWIVGLMRSGIIVLNKCVGISPTLRLRRKTSYKKSGDNSINNLEIKKGTDNYKGEIY